MKITSNHKKMIVEEKDKNENLKSFIEENKEIAKCSKKSN